MQGRFLPILIGVPFPSIPAPPDLGASLGDAIFDGNSTATISTSFLCDDLRVRNRFVLRISGDVTIGVQNTFEMYNYAKIELAPGAHLTLYVAGSIELNEHSTLNVNTADYSQVDVYYLGTSTVRMTQNTTFYGSLNAPN